MSWCLIIPAVLITLLAIVALVAPSQVFWLIITSLLRGCIAIILLIAAMLLTGLVLLIQGMPS
ncbi:MAG: hypothetical protein J7463_04915 [Roseiflexus sp.]|jgi:hypothetical protein|nr:hypothetical protein [Roseiflexus sp.]MBO9333714.1 hypothetical protein [Roseiflexus sp.]MBO9342892.1 hypothetical protein [Roseiflexus sp.]MBO9384633.1 hypothetical protein [Roseiflexus sp.]MBO9391069.1 hypothetical protein [Roseiflexus sp.]